MKTKLFIIASAVLSLHSIAQNDLDALRYSQTGVGGNARFISMGGAFGALGANASCASYNPAGLGVYRKGEINISPGLRFTNVNSNFNGNQERNLKPVLLFNGLGIAGSWQSKSDEDSRHSLAFSLNQLQNFSSSTNILGRANNTSIGNALLANAGNSNPQNLDPSYSGLAFSTYLLDTINGSNNYYSFANSKYKMLQGKTIETSGRMNELAIAYAYGYKDKLYVGASLGIPMITYNHSSTFTETDDKDSLYIKYNSSTSTYSSSYDYSVYYYSGLGGFQSMSYNETYKTTGRGYNLKLGVLYRLNEYLRLGAHYHTPTILNLTDVYSYQMTSKFDEGNSYAQSYPENGGTFKYMIITPMRYGASLGFIYQKWFSIGLDYESVDYGQARLGSTTAGVFSDVNSTIRNKYQRANNIRMGAEFNINPVVLRAGFASYGSPFGETLTGDFVRNTVSGGLGFRKNNWTLDVAVTQQIYTEDHYLFNPKYSEKASLKYSGTNFVITLGSKF